MGMARLSGWSSARSSASASPVRQRARLLDRSDHREVIKQFSKLLRVFQHRQKAAAAQGRKLSGLRQGKQAPRFGGPLLVFLAANEQRRQAAFADAPLKLRVGLEG